ncbi:MAG: four helix bundle protein [Patescibacteria group bacterium]
MDQIINFKRYDLEERSLKFAKQTRSLVKSLPKSINNFEDGKQLIRSSGSVGANYIEANESLSKKDFIMRVKIAKKEAKETRFWLELIDIKGNQELEKIRLNLITETLELMKILGSIVEKSKYSL